MKLVVKVIFTQHARLKLRIYHAHKVRIAAKDINQVLNSPTIQTESDLPVIKVVGELDERHSLVVLYKMQDAKIIIITFWPAAKGRYESQI